MVCSTCNLTVTRERSHLRFLRPLKVSHVLFFFCPVGKVFSKQRDQVSEIQVYVLLVSGNHFLATVLDLSVSV